MPPSRRRSPTRRPSWRWPNTASVRGRAPSLGSQRTPPPPARRHSRSRCMPAMSGSSSPTRAIRRTSFRDDGFLFTNPTALRRPWSRLPTASTDLDQQQRVQRPLRDRRRLQGRDFPDHVGRRQIRHHQRPGHHRCRTITTSRINTRLTSGGVLRRSRLPTRSAPAISTWLGGSRLAVPAEVGCLHRHHVLDGVWRHRQRRYSRNNLATTAGVRFRF